MSGPGWFTDALAQAPEVGSIEVADCPISYRRWGQPEHAGVVLIHGGAAHARWWDFIAPLLASTGYHVAALDLSGHGDSGRRERYEPTTWADEVAAVADELGMARPVLIGHSMGGFVSIVAAARFGDRLAGTVIVDSPVLRPDPERVEARRGRMFAAPKTYPTLEEAMGHFVLVPPQPCEHEFIIEHVARTSLCQGEGGWTWKFDPKIFGRFSPRDPVFSDYLADARCRVAVFHGELSAIVDADVRDWMSQLLGRNAPFVEIPQAHHHVFLDQPLAFVAASRAMLADWEHTVPAQRDEVD